jgi:hypothetical protein
VDGAFEDVPLTACNGLNRRRVGDRFPARLPTGGELLELDPQTGEALSRFELAVGGDFEPAPDRPYGASAGSGWNELERLDPVSGEVDVTDHLDRKPIPTAIAVAPNSVWVLTYDGTMTRLALN